MELREFFFKGLKTTLIYLLISSALSVCVFCLYYYLMLDKLGPYIAPINASAIVSISFIGFGVLVILTRWGAFDTFSYGFSTMFSSMFAKKVKQYDDLVQYKKIKSIKRDVAPNYYLAFFLVGLVYIVCLIVFEIIYHQAF